jgi:flotillin
MPSSAPPATPTAAITTSPIDGLTKKEKALLLGAGVAGAVVLGGATFLALRFHTSASWELLVRTGWRVPEGPTGTGLQIGRTFLQLPFQQVHRISLNPVTVPVKVAAMTTERLEFELPLSFTVGPSSDDPALQAQYAKLVMDQKAQAVEDLIKGVVEGEVRILAAGVSIETIFKDRDGFHRDIVEKVARVLSRFGLIVHAANIRELCDVAGSEYFKFLRQKAREQAVNKAKIDVAQARAEGNIGEKIREGETRRQLAEIEAVTYQVECAKTSEKERSAAELDLVKVEQKQRVALANIAAKAESSQREAALQAEVERANATATVEQQRATTFAKEVVAAETRVRQAQGDADAARLRAQGQADAVRTAADARAHETEKIGAAKANAELAAATAAADGKRLALLRYAEGLEGVKKQLGGNPEALQWFLAVESGLVKDIAAATATAVRDMAPKINVWQTSGGGNGNGDGGGGSGDFMAPVTKIAQGLPMLMKAVSEQTGVTPPAWMAKELK